MVQGVDKIFSARMAELKAQAAAMVDSLMCKVQRVWQVPASQEVSMYNIPDLHMPAFNRAQLNEDYTAIVMGQAERSSGGEVLGLRLQIAVVAAEERAYRHRHMSMVRSICNAHGRSYGQGYGSLFGATGIEGDAATYIRAGSVQTDIIAEEKPTDGSVVA